MYGAPARDAAAKGATMRRRMNNADLCMGELKSLGYVFGQTIAPMRGKI
jgi:hypothetical protein